MAAPKPLEMVAIPANASAQERRDILAVNRNIAALNRQQAADYARGQREQAAASRGRSSAVQVKGRVATATSILPESGEVRLIDGLITVAVAAVTVVWTATRTATASLGWAVFWILLGTLMGVEGRGELRYLGFGTSAANASYLALRIAQLAKTEPAAAYAQANAVSDAYSQGDYAAMARIGSAYLRRLP